MAAALSDDNLLAPAPKALESSKPPAVTESDDETRKRYDQFNKDQTQQLDEAGKANDDAAAKNRVIEGKIGELKPPVLQSAPYNKPEKTSPQEQWGSVAMGFAMLASLFTRRPLTTALNAGAAVMEAYKAGDKEAADRAYEQWQTASQNTLKQADFQRKTYDDLLRGYERQENINTTEGAAKERTTLAKVAAQAKAFQDENSLKILQDKGLEGWQRMQEVMRKNEEQFRIQTEKMEAYKEKQDRLAAVVRTPEYAAAAAAGDNVGMLKLFADADPGKYASVYAKALSQRSFQASKAATTEQDSLQRVQSTQDYIGRAIELSQELPSSGLGQMGEKLKERVAGAAGINVENPAQAYDDYIDSIKTQILAEKQGSGRGTQNAQYRAALDNLLPKISHWEGSTGQTTQLKILANTMNRLHGLPDKYTEVEVTDHTPNVPKWEAPSLNPGGGATLGASPAPRGLQPTALGGPPPALRGASGARPGSVDRTRQPTPQEAASAKPITKAGLAAAPAGWYRDSQGKVAYWTGSVSATPTPEVDPALMAP